jgi:hypothetical protein
VATFVWNQWQFSRGISGNFALEWVATFAWNMQHVLDSQRLLTMIDVAETVKDETERDALKKEIVWKALGIEQSPQQGARLCENPALKSLLCFQQLLACTGPLPSPPSGDAAHMITLRPSMSQPRAAISRGISTRFNTR